MAFYGLLDRTPKGRDEDPSKPNLPAGDGGR
jgi:predicted dithiol-disulfide oxidoreductase (DUF899 family)